MWFQIYGPGDPNPPGRVLWSLPVTVSDFAPRSHHTGEAGLPKPDSGPAPDSLGLGLSPEIHPKAHGRVPWTNPFTIRPFLGVPHYYWDAGLTRTHSDSLGLTRTHSELGYLQKYTQKHTVVYLWPIRSLLYPFHVSHTIIGTSDSLGLPRTHSELPGLGLSPEIHPNVHGRVPWANPFTIRPFPDIPHYYGDVGRPGRVSGSIPWSRTGWPVGLHTGFQISRLIPEGYIYFPTEIYT